MHKYKVLRLYNMHKMGVATEKNTKNVNIVLFLAMIVQDFCNIFVIEYM